MEGAATNDRTMKEEVFNARVMVKESIKEGGINARVMGKETSREEVIVVWITLSRQFIIVHIRVKSKLRYEGTKFDVRLAQEKRG